MQFKHIILLTICTLLIGVCGIIQVEARCNVDNCEYCDSGASCVCLKCKQNYALNNLGQCSKQVSCNVAHCSICTSTSSSTCLRCEDGYIWDDDQEICEMKPECYIRHCELCYSDNASKCLNCQVSYNSTEDEGWCYRDSHTCNIDHCRDCDWCKKGSCATCRNGYHVTDNGTCAPGNSYDFATHTVNYLLYFAILLMTGVIVMLSV